MVSCSPLPPATSCLLSQACLLFDLMQPGQWSDHCQSVTTLMLPLSLASWWSSIPSYCLFCLSSPVSPASSSSSVPLFQLSCPPPRCVHLILAIHPPPPSARPSRLSADHPTHSSVKVTHPTILLSLSYLGREFSYPNHTSAPAIDLR